MMTRCLAAAWLVLVFPGVALCGSDAGSPRDLDDATRSVIEARNTTMLVERFRTDPQAGIRLLAQNVRKLHPELRHVVILAIGQLASSEYEPISSPEVTRILAEIWLDQQDSLETGSGSTASELLLSAPSEAFAPDIKERIADRLSKQPSREAILLAGAAEVKQAVPLLEAMADDEENPHRAHAESALARMGKARYVAKVVKAFREESDQQKKVTIRLMTVVYIRQHEGIAAMGNMLMSNERMRWTGQARSDRRTFPVSKLAAAAMARLLPDFPVKKRIYNDDDIARCREWWQHEKAKFAKPPMQ